MDIIASATGTATECHCVLRTHGKKVRMSYNNRKSCHDCHNMPEHDGLEVPYRVRIPVSPVNPDSTTKLTTLIAEKAHMATTALL